MKHPVRRTTAAALAALVLLCLPRTVLADSSWQWFSEYRPLDLFPLLAAATLLIEIPLIHLVPRLKGFWKTAGAVTLANLLSFGIPWLLRLLVYRENAAVYPLFSQFLESSPEFTTDFFNCALTLLVELPAVWLLLGRGKGPKQQKRLLWTAFAANTATTLLCAAVEHTLCYGSW